MKKIHVLTCIIILFGNICSLLSADNNVNLKDPYMMPYYTGVIVPTPQQVEYKDEYLSLTNTGIILNDIKQDDARLKYLLERIIRYGGKYEIIEKPASNYTCVIIMNANDIEAPRKAEGYAIKTDGKTISLKGNDFQGLLWAISSLNQMIFIKDGKAVVRSVNITDWPDHPIRGMLGDATECSIEWYAHFMVAFKFNAVDFRGYIPGKAEYILDKDAYGPDGFDKERYYESLNILKKVMTPLKISWYAGCWPESTMPEKTGDANTQLNCSNDKHLNFFYNTIYKQVAEAGGNIDIQFDDFRFPIHPDDMKKFGSAAKADYDWVLRMYNKVKMINPDIKVLFCPPFYFGPKSEAPYPEDRDTYLKTIGQLPKAIDFYWTGPSVKGRKTDTSDTKWYTDLIGRKPYVFQNAVGTPHIYLYHYGSDPVYKLKKWYYKGYLNDIKGYFINGGGRYTAGVAVSVADWTWNEKQFDPEKTIAEAVKKLMGPDAYPEMVKVNKSLSFFDKYYSVPVSPNALKHAKEITAAYEELKKDLVALEKASIPEPYNYWMTLYSGAAMNFASKALPEALKDPAANRYIQDVEATRKKAEKEAGLNSKTDIFRSALEFSGGMNPQFYNYKQAKKGIDIKRRLCTWIYGAESIRPALTTSFEIEPFPPSGDYKLIISGLDDDSTNKCPIKIDLNGYTIFSGANPFSNKDWNLKEFTIPADKLHRNNILTIANTAASDSLSGPPFFMLNYAILRDTKK